MNDKMITVAVEPVIEIERHRCTAAANHQLTINCNGDMVAVMTVVICVVDVMQDHSSSHDPREPAGR